MQPPGSPGPGQDPYQQQPPYQPSYGQTPQYPDPFAPQSGDPYTPDPFAPQSPSPAQPAEYSLYPQPQLPPPPPPPQYPPPQYPMGGYSVPPMQMAPMANSRPSNTFGLLSMIFGIISIPLLCCLYIGLPVGIAAIVLGIIGINKAKAGEADNKGMSIAGVACGGTASLLGVLWLVAVFAFNVSSPYY